MAIAKIGVIRAVNMPDIRGLTTPNGVAINPKTPFTTATIMPSKSSNPKVFSHRLLTSSRLRERLPKTPVPSSIIDG